jgi:hypothetical protein
LTHISRSETREYESETPDASLDHVLPETHDKGVGFICLETGGVCRESTLKLRKRAHADRYDESERENYNEKPFTFHNVKVTTYCLFKYRVSEQAAFGDVTHEKFYYHEQLVYDLVESRCKFGCWSTADCLLQVSVRSGVVELHCLDSAQIVVIASVLRIWSRGGEVCF